jgi:beta-glucanase (GH16 family)
MRPTPNARRAAGAALCALAFAACASKGPPTMTTSAPSGGTPPPPTQWTLTWSDEFDGPAGASFDRTRWVADTGGGGWGNQEREFYTTRPENVALDGDGHLVITARAEPAGSSLACWYGACRYTSARLKTQGRFDQTYGRFEARIRIPRGQGLWPAFWMLGRDIDTVGWPRCGEIDVMENIGREPRTVHGTIHGPGYSGSGGIGGPYELASTAFADDFHVFAVEWEPGVIRWLVDDKEYRRTTSSDIPSGTTWVYDHPFFLLLNVAVGGGWPGDPDATTTFPQQMVVDYVRVYRR